MTGEFALRVAEDSDLEFLYSLFKTVLGSYVEQTFGTWQEEKERARFRERTKVETHKIVQLEGEPIGCLSVQWQPNQVKLNRVFLLPDYQNLGLGSRLVRQIQADAVAAGLPVRLRVYKVNPAQRRWQRLGFVVTGETDTHLLMEYTARQH